MEEQISTETKVKFYKKKAFYIPLGLICLASLVYAAVIFSSVPVTITVHEALQTESFAVNPTGYPGETITQEINVTNDASVNLPVEITFTQTSNPDSVDYSTDMPKNVTLSSGNNTIIVNFYISTGSPSGTFSGEINLTRV